jgi:hypothetical protein
MGDIVNLRHAPIDLNSDVGHAFVVDATRAGEGLITDKELAEKYELSPSDWQNITKDLALGRAVRAERERRLLNGVAARESAARHFVRTPTVLAGIMDSETSNPRHVIEAAKEIRAVAMAGSGTDRAAESEQFIIRIDLSADGGRHVETYDKAIKIDVSDGDRPNNLIEGNPDADDQW